MVAPATPPPPLTTFLHKEEGTGKDGKEREEGREREDGWAMTVQTHTQQFTDKQVVSSQVTGPNGMVAV